MANELLLLTSLTTGYIFGKSSSENGSHLANDSRHLVEVQDLQSAVNKALIDAIEYENAIRELEARLADREDSGPTVDFLKLQLADLQENYDLLMTYTRSKVGELPTSFTVQETPVNGIHISPNEVFDRSKYDRNLKIVDGALHVNGVTNFKVPVYVLQGGNYSELRTYYNPGNDAFLLNLEAKDLVSQIKVGNNETAWNLTSSAQDSKLEPLILIEFDKSVNLKILLNNILLGGARHNGTRWDVNLNGGVFLYRSNVLAFKIFGMYTYADHRLMNLVLRTLTGTQQLMINSAAVVNSCHATVKEYVGTAAHNDMLSSYKLIGKAVDFE